MQFSTRQLLICVTAISVWFWICSLAFSYFGPPGTIAAALFGIAISMGVTIQMKRSKWPAGKLCICAVVLIVSLVEGTLETKKLYGFWLASQEQSRVAEELRLAFLADPRFHSVKVSYEDSLFGEVKYVRVYGSVPDGTYARCNQRVNVRRKE